MEDILLLVESKYHPSQAVSPQVYQDKKKKMRRQWWQKYLDEILKIKRGRLRGERGGDDNRKVLQISIRVKLKFPAPWSEVSLSYGTRLPKTESLKFESSSGWGGNRRSMLRKVIDNVVRYRDTATYGVNILQLESLFSAEEDAPTHLERLSYITITQRRVVGCSTPVDRRFGRIGMRQAEGRRVDWSQEEQIKEPKSKSNRTVCVSPIQRVAYEGGSSTFTGKVNDPYLCNVMEDTFRMMLFQNNNDVLPCVLVLGQLLK
uniref:Uncharacterized protein n=1 Tax=Timema poppense TaxID=170557 RepID=A0A7R9GWY5_TIMPO|nr:unnamed protein product [Timema poppensis]